MLRISRAALTSLCVDTTRAVWAAFCFRFVPNNVPVDLKRHEEEVVRVQELCESRGGRPGLSVLMSLTVSVDVKQH